MGLNVEMKAKVKDVNSFRKIAEQLSDTKVQVIKQHDTFFNCENGRLKLRQLESVAKLIFYNRPDSEGPKLSDYQIYNTNTGHQLYKVLEKSNGIKGKVEKTRYLYMVGQTRVHVDDVRDLGHFMELEVVLSDDQTAEDGRKIADDVMKQLGVKNGDLIKCAYVDMLLAQKK